MVTEGGRYGNAVRRLGAGVRIEEAWRVEADRTWSFRGLGRRGVDGLSGVEGGLEGPMADRAAARRLAVSLDHCSYRAWVAGFGFVSGGGVGNAPAPFC